MRPPVQHASMSALEQPSTYLVIEMSCTLALPPLAEPAPVCRSPLLLTPHDQARIGTSPLCFLWLDAPSILTLPAPNLMCMSNAMKPSPYVSCWMFDIAGRTEVLRPVVLLLRY